MKKTFILYLMIFFSISLSAVEMDDIFYIISTGQLEEYNKLKSQTFDMNSRDRNGKTLVIAAVCGILDFQSRNSGITALHSAADNGDYATVELLLKNGADVFMQDPSGQTPYLLALRNHNTAAADLILKYLKSGKPKYMEGSVTDYISKNYIPIFEDLLKKEINVNLKDFSGNTALYYAVKTGMEDVVKLLIEKGANVNIVSGENGKSPLIVSSESGFVQITELLLSAGADVNVAYSVSGSENSSKIAALPNELQYYEQPQGFNLKISIRSENPDNPDNDNRSFYKIYIDKVEAGRTSVGLDSQNKIFTASIDANKHLLRVEKYTLDESQKKYVQVNNIYQPDPDYIYLETFSDRILTVEIIHTPRNIKSRYEMRFLKKGEH